MTPASLEALGVLMAGIDASGPALPSWAVDALAGGLASVCLFAMNTPDVPRTRALTDALRAVGPQVVVAVDEEGGDVTRLQAQHGSDLPGAAALGAVGDVGLTEDCAEALGRLVGIAGVDLDLAPVLDVACEARNPVIGVRSFGATSGVVTEQGAAFVRGLHAAGTRACGKHFPGHGSTRVDSHIALPWVAADAATVLDRDLAPFRDVRVDALMTAHLWVPSLGDGPASLSPWSTALARRLGHAGPIITDALGMAGASATIGLGEACVRALEAGADLLCLDAPHERDPERALAQAVEAIDAALAAGRLDPVRLRASAALTATLGRDTYPSVGELEATQAELARLGHEAGGRALVVSGDVRIWGPAVLVDLRAGSNAAAGRVPAAMADAFAARRPTAAAEGATSVVVTGRANIDEQEATALRVLLDSHPDAVVIHTGVLEAAPNVPRLVCTLGSGRPNAEAAMTAILGSPEQ